MSYDVYVSGEDLNITSNLSEFFIAFGVYPPDWHGMRREDVALSIDAALALIRKADMPLLEAKYNAENGWGTVRNAIDWLRRVRVACRRQVTDVVEVSW